MMIWEKRLFVIFITIGKAKLKMEMTIIQITVSPNNDKDKIHVSKQGIMWGKF